MFHCYYGTMKPTKKLCIKCWLVSGAKKKFGFLRKKCSHLESRPARADAKVPCPLSIFHVEDKVELCGSAGSDHRNILGRYFLHFLRLLSVWVRGQSSGRGRRQSNKEKAKQDKD